MGSATVANASVVNLTWWTMWSGSTLQLLNQMMAQFNKTHPGIHVTETNIPSVATTSTAKLLSSIAAGDPPDIFTEWWPEIGEFAADGDLDSLNQFLTGQYPASRSGSTRSRSKAAATRTSLYAVPMGLNSWALYYNKNIMAKAGITSPPKTLAAARRRRGQRVGHKQRQAPAIGHSSRTQMGTASCSTRSSSAPQLLQVRWEVRL